MNDLPFTVRPSIGILRAGAVAMAALALLSHPSGAAGAAQDALTLEPGKILEIACPDAALPPTLYAMVHGTPVTPCVTVRLPEDYTPDRKFPLVLYVPGNDGGVKGNPDNAAALAGTAGWVGATLPLFKKAIDPSEPFDGKIVNFEDYSVLSRAYGVLLGRLFAAIPNLDRERSAMVGFSNGAITIGVLVTNHDEFVLTHFRNFCLVDQGMFQLADLHRSRARDARFLLLVGDQPDMGRAVKIRQARVQQDAWRLLGVNVTAQVMENTGHEFNAPQIELVRNWLRGGATAAPASVPPTNP